MDILIFWCLKIDRWKNLAFQGCAKTVWILHPARDEHPDNHSDTSEHHKHPETPSKYPQYILQTPFKLYLTSTKQTDTNRHSPTFQALPGAVWGWLKVPVDVSQCLLAQPWEAIFVSPGHTETSKYQNVHIYPEQKWLGFTFFSSLVFVREKLKDTFTWITLYCCWRQNLQQRASWPGFLASGKDSRTKVVLARKL